MCVYISPVSLPPLYLFRPQPHNPFGIFFGQKLSFPTATGPAITEGITTGLSFLLVSEVLKTIIDRDWTSIGMTCAILLMRASISLLVHWESKAEAEHE